jgi:transmembrane sensor
MVSSVDIEQRAAEWLARRTDEDWNEASEAGLREWLASSTAHRVAFIRLKTAWERAARLKALSAGTPAEGVLSPATWRFSPVFDGHGARSRARAVASPRVWAAAAAVLLAVGALLWSGRLLNGESYATAVGGLESVPMVDGSQITLNTDSRVRLALDESERRVDLAQGEAYFQVAKDGARPFVVRAGETTITALGTEFSVRLDGDDVRVFVTEGRVRVERAGGPVSGAPAELVAGNVARSAGRGVVIQEKAIADVERYLSWRRGFLIFRDTPLAEAVAEFNRYSHQQLVIEDPSIAGIGIGGSFRSSNVEAFIRLLEEGLGLGIERRPDRIILKGV